MRSKAVVAILAATLGLSGAAASAGVGTPSGAIAASRSSAAGADEAAASSFRILYASDSSFPSNEIYVADPTGRKPIGRLTFGQAPPCRRWIGNACGWAAPEPSPDGRKVAMWFRHHSDNLGPVTASLFVSRADGRSRIPIVHSVPVCRCQTVPAAWSPDSRSIAYRTGERWHVVRAADPSDRSDSLVPPAWVPDPRLSPDRRWIVTRGDRDLILNDTRRGSRRTFAIRIHEFAWSDDSRRLGMSAADGGLYVLEMSSLRLRRLTADRAYELDWSPDARSLAYVAYSPSNGNEAGDIRVVDLQGRVKTVVDAAGDTGGIIRGLAWTRVPTDTSYRQPPARFPVADGTATLPWDVDRLATDGERVALTSCGHVFVWSPARREVLQAENNASLTQECSSSEVYLSLWLYDLAIAGNRVAWGYHQGNTGQTAELFVSSLGTQRNLTSLGSRSGAPRVSGIGELAGSGELLAYSTWNEDCVDGTNCRRFVTREQSVRLAGASGCPCPVLRSEPGPFVPLAVDGGRIVAAGDNSLIVLNSSGAELLSIPVRAAAASLSGRDLVVVVQGTLRQHDVETGALLHAWPLPNVASGQRCATPNRSCVHPTLVLEDTERGLVTYVVDKQVHVLRLADGASVVISPGQAASFINSGLVYALGPRLRHVRFEDLPIR